MQSLAAVESVIAAHLDSNNPQLMALFRDLPDGVQKRVTKLFS
jgi:hypothetical protein